MSVKIRLKDLDLGQLNNECLLKVSRFVRELRAETGIKLRMQDKDILKQISNHCREIDNPHLQEIYAELKQEILKSVYSKMSKDSK